MVCKADKDSALYELDGSIDGISVERFDAHLHNINSQLRNLGVCIRCQEDFKKYREQLVTITFIYYKGW